MTGQIPPYGEFFRRESLPYSPDWANRQYVLKSDKRYAIRSDKTSESWHVLFCGRDCCDPFPNMRGAMLYLVPQSTWRKFTLPMEFAWAATREHQGWSRLDARNYLKPLVAHPNQAITRCIAAGIITQSDAGSGARLTALSIQTRDRKVRPS